jgi:hypothetical protein
MTAIAEASLEKTSSRSWVGGVLAAVLVVAAVLLHYFFATHETALTSGGLTDTDSYMHVIRALELWNGAGWHDTLTMRLGAPDGHSLHWTRLVDLLILGPAAAAHLFGADMARAVYWSGALFSIACHILACFAVAWAAKPLWPTPGNRIAAAALLLNFAAFAYSVFGRADHHALLLLLTALLLGAMLRAALGGVEAGMRRRWSAIAGAVAGFGIWVSPEIMVPLAPVMGAIGLFWVFETDADDWAGAGLSLSLAMAAVILVAVPIEQANWLAAEYDKVSFPYLVLPLTWAVVFAAARSVQPGFRRRISTGALLGSLGIGFLLLTFPDLFLGPLSVDPRLKKDFLDGVSEMKPLWPTDPDRRHLFLLELGQALIGVLLLPIAFKVWSGPRRRPGILITIALLFLLVAGMMHARLGVELAPAAVIVGSGFFALLDKKLAGRSALIRMPGLFLAAVLLTSGPIIASVFVLPKSDGESKSPSCQAPALAEWLMVHHPDRGGIVMTANISDAPELAFRTDYRFVAGPYHRGAEAIFDTLDVVRDRSEGRVAAKKILDRRQVSLILLCTDGLADPLPAAQASAFYGAMSGAGAIPSWLKPIALPADLAQHWKLFEIDGRP